MELVVLFALSTGSVITELQNKFLKLLLKYLVVTLERKI